MSYHSYHIEGGNTCFKELPSRILMREDGYLSAYRLDGKPIADYWYVPESECLKLHTENSNLRELTKEMFYSLLNVAAGRRIMTAGEAQNLMGRMNALGVEVDG